MCLLNVKGAADQSKIPIYSIKILFSRICPCDHEAMICFVSGMNMQYFLNHKVCTILVVLFCLVWFFYAQEAKQETLAPALTNSCERPHVSADEFVSGPVWSKFLITPTFLPVFCILTFCPLKTMEHLLTCSRDRVYSHSTILREKLVSSRGLLFTTMLVESAEVVHVHKCAISNL